MTRSRLNLSPSAPGHQANASPNLPILVQSQGSQSLSGIRFSQVDKNPHSKGSSYTDQACLNPIKSKAGLLPVDWVLKGNLVPRGVGSCSVASGSVFSGSV